jgi:hypothetical protein
MGSINAKWHRVNPMPKNPTMDQRIAWHLAHAKACGRREISGRLLEEMKRRGINVPAAPRAQGPRLAAAVPSAPPA